MRIVLDLEAAQADDLALAVAQAILRRADGHDVVAVLNAGHRPSLERVRAAFDGLLPPERLVTWDAPRLGGEWGRAAAALVRRAFLANLDPGLVLAPDGREDDPDRAAERLLATTPEARPAEARPSRPRLAYVSPLPPARSGIADYSAELLPELARRYDIDVIVEQAEVTTPWVLANCRILDGQSLLAHADEYDRVLYHFGNSPFHQHMFGLMERVPGVAVLHEFYLGDALRYREVYGPEPHLWTRELYGSAGYGAVAERFGASDIGPVVARHPANFSPLRDAVGVIVHSLHMGKLAERWYGANFADDWAQVPLPRLSPSGDGRVEARRQLGLDDDAFVTCAFGMLGANKRNRRLLDGWAMSPLASDPRCRLIFVGENSRDALGAEMTRAIADLGLGQRVRITGWTDPATYRRWLAAADLAVQLRTDTRGETSAAALDCLNHGVPTIVNANGALAELPADAVAMLRDDFSDAELAATLEALRHDRPRRAALGRAGRALVAARHAPAACADAYADAIERMYAGNRRSPLHERHLIRSLAALPGSPPTERERLRLASDIARALPRRRSGRQLLVDVSATARGDLKTGIQRVVRALTLALLAHPPAGYRVEPVVLSDAGGAWRYRHARRWTSRLMDMPDDWIADEAAEFEAGDILLIADFTGAIAVAADKADVFSRLRDQGVALHFVVYDLLPISMPEMFPPGRFGFTEWAEVVAKAADGVICISRAVADEVERWMPSQRRQRHRPPRIGWFHLGSDFQNSRPTKGRPPDAAAIARLMARAPTFLMVGTVEPRKGHPQVLAAFDDLWAKGVAANLVIAGAEGWRGLPDAMRRDIPDTVARLRAHPRLGRQLIWLDGASDEFLEEVYTASTCLIAASHGEGFGLPLIEAAQHGLPILARDLAVFREVAGAHASYFRGEAPEDLARAVERWLTAWRDGGAPPSADMPRQSWSQSALQVRDAILGSEFLS
ncbi:MAG: glycosyltransferase [Alphaproteobacteria bacterium]|nr:glycosyltransferase [Alphaproteobacteria bacterium]